MRPYDKVQQSRDTQRRVYSGLGLQDLERDPTLVNLTRIVELEARVQQYRQLGLNPRDAMDKALGMVG